MILDKKEAFISVLVEKNNLGGEASDKIKIAVKRLLNIKLRCCFPLENTLIF